jgi:hypothetical protein
MMRFADLSEREILALAISSEEEDSKIYRGFAEGLRELYPAPAKVFDKRPNPATHINLRSGQSEDRRTVHFAGLGSAAAASAIRDHSVLWFRRLRTLLQR